MLEQLTPMQMARKFEAEHGPASERDGSWIYYPDGARREVNPMGAFVVPPTNERERCHLQVYYNRLRVARLVRVFDEAKQEATALAKNTTSTYDHTTTLARLRAMRGEVNEAREALAEAEEALRFAATGRTQEEERRLQQATADTEAQRQRQREELEAIDV